VISAMSEGVPVDHEERPAHEAITGAVQRLVIMAKPQDGTSQC
jgi:hypothetical protein